jgi:radical SAM superfamily enzyme YgiQ (UPF0313 family)
MVDVLLVNPYVLARHEPRVASYRPYPPLGLMYLGAVLRERGYTVEIYDGTFADSTDRILALLERAERPRVAGVFAMNSFRDDALETIRRFKERGITVFAGGPDPSIYDEEYLRGGVDVVVRGEGEVAILELLEAYRVEPNEQGLPCPPADEVISKVLGVSFLDREVHLARAPDRPASKSMDELPTPAYDLIDLDRYVREWRRVHGYASIQFMTSRGCPFSCTWCARPIFGRRYRQYGPERAVEEIAVLTGRYGIDHLWLFDDTFVVRREWVEAFCEEIVARGVKVRWECLARVDLVDRDLLVLMKRAGCERINFGFESGSQRVLDGMKKGTTTVDARRVAKAMHEVGIAMGGYVLMGYPGEEWEDIEKTIDLLREIQPVDYSTSVALPMPGTEFFSLVRDMLLEDQKWSEHDPDSVIWKSPYSRGFYRVVESLIHTEYDLALEFTLQKYVKSKVLRSVLGGMRLMGDGKDRIDRYRDPRFFGWRGQRTADKAERHRVGHKVKAEKLKREKAQRLRVLS